MAKRKRNMGDSELRKNKPIANKPGAGKQPNAAKLKGWAVNLAVLLATFFVLFLVAEIVWRFALPNSVTPGYWPEENKVYVPELKRMMYANVINLTKSTKEFSYTINTNENGFRDSHEKEKQEGVVRVIGLGDSMTFGNTVEQNETYLYRLEEELNQFWDKEGYKVEVINLGAGGFGTKEEEIALEKYGLGYEPDLVLVGFYINDFKDSLNYEKREPSEKSVFRVIFSKSRFANWVYWNIKISPAGSRIINKLGLNIDQQDEYEFEMALLDKERYDKDARLKESIGYVFSSFKKIKKICDENGAKLVVVYVPSDYQIYPERLEKIKEIRGMGNIQLDVDYAQKVLAGFFEKEGIEFADFSDEFRNEKDKTELYWYYDRHLNKNGYRHLAGLIFEKLKYNVENTSDKNDK